jgi:hypothetical protein
MFIRKSSDKYNFIICQWKDFGLKEKKVIDNVLTENQSVIIAIREYEICHINKITPLEVMSKIMDEYKDEIKKNLLKVMVIPDISSVTYLGSSIPLSINEL